MATKKILKDAVVISGKFQDGKFSKKKFTRKRYGAKYKELADQCLSELINYNNGGTMKGGVAANYFKNATVKDLTDRYNNEHLSHTRAAGNKSYLDLICKKFGPLRLHAVSVSLVRDWIILLLDQKKYSPYSVKKVVRYFIRIFNWALEIDIVPVNPIAKLIDMNLKKKFARLCVKREVSIGSEEFLAFCDKISNLRTKRVALISWYTGMREGEICDLEWSSIHGNHIKLLHNDNKECKPKIVVLEPGAQTVLSEIEAEQLINGRSDRVFPGLTVVKNCRSFAHYSKKYMNGLRFHDIRHAYERRKRLEGVHQKVINAQLGHKGNSSDMSYTYDTITMDDMQILRKDS